MATDTTGNPYAVRLAAAETRYHAAIAAYLHDDTPETISALRIARKAYRQAIRAAETYNGGI